MACWLGPCGPLVGVGGDQEGAGGLSSSHKSTRFSLSSLRPLGVHVKAPAIIHYCSLRHPPEGSRCRKQQDDLPCE